MTNIKIFRVQRMRTELKQCQSSYSSYSSQFAYILYFKYLDIANNIELLVGSLDIYIKVYLV